MPMPPTTACLSLRELANREKRVFPVNPQVARYFPSAAMEDARKRLGRAIERGDGPGLVIGAPGTGKSLLLQVLAAQYHQRFDVVLLAAARLCTRRALLQAILFELGLPYKLRDEGELRLSLLDHLLSTDECLTGLLMLVDEAQSLPTALLEELRVMTNLVRDDRPRVRLVLAGASALEETFAHPELESFSQRLSCRCYLAPLRREETTQFVRAQIAASNGSPDEALASDAWEAVFEATDGVPRLVNQLCDRALQFAAAGNRGQIDREVVQQAWADLQQLPIAWEAPSASPSVSPQSPAIEFGALDGGASAEDKLLPADEEVIEPTELDMDDDADQLQHAAAQRPHAASATESRPDPFAEQFEEEEVVLDAFAAWDEMFRRETPRVENRRDPGFAPLVQAAIEAAAPTCESGGANPSPLAVLRDGEDEDARSDEDLSVGSSAANRRSAQCPDDSDWPPLRLAVVAEPAPLKSIPLVPPSKQFGAVGPAAWEAVANDAVKPRAGKPLADETPVLVVEEENVRPRTNSPVRREEYQRLFSRLRSG